MNLVQSPTIRKNQTLSTNKRSSIPKNLIVLSHLRWDFVFQRPQHLLTRFAKKTNIYFIEEPIFDALNESYYSSSNRGEKLAILVPHLPAGLSSAEITEHQKKLFAHFVEDKPLEEYGFWYYTPMALEYTREHYPALVVFDCMDELSAFKFAPENIKALEFELLNIADIVFTGGHSLYETKKDHHNAIYPFPSSIEKEHFLHTRKLKNSAFHKANDHLTLGFYGVIDERFDIALIKEIADARKNWRIKLIGPIVKIDPSKLPDNANIQYIGPKKYDELPTEMAGWDIAMIPFLLNDSTKFISPTKTPEYLAAGLPVLSTPIKDVINPYARNQMVGIGSTALDFIRMAEAIASLSKSEREAWLEKVDIFLADLSWDKTCDQMEFLIGDTIKKNISVIQQV